MRALVVRQADNGAVSAAVETIDPVPAGDLADGEVRVAVAHSTVNYKDGLCMSGQGGLVRRYPHVPGVDFAGHVIASRDTRFRPGDGVILTGWRVGEVTWGGYADEARVRGDWLVPLPAGMTTRTAMVIGTAGLTAMLALEALEAHGLQPGAGPVLVTGAAGGVGSMAVALLAAAGHEVAAVTGRPEQADYLQGLGARRIVPRADLAETVARPLESETWAGAIDAVGGKMLARLLGQMRSRASVAAVGLAGGAQVPMSIVPFLLRGVNLLGIDSVTEPTPTRLMAWSRIAALLEPERLEAMAVDAKLADLPSLGRAILEGQVRGRVVVDVRG